MLNTFGALIEDYNETVRAESIRLVACTYLHSMKQGNAINVPFYEHHTRRAPGES